MGKVTFVVRKDLESQRKTLWLEHTPELARKLWPTGKPENACEYNTRTEAEAAADEYKARYFISGYRVAARLPRHA